MLRVVDDLGAAVPVADEPARIVSLVPSLSETLAHWGMGDRLVGVTEWCVEPRGAFDRAVRVRGTKNPDVDRIRALAPTLVLANEEENREIDVRRLRQAGVAVYVTRVRTVPEAAHSLQRLGHVLGGGQAVDTLAGQLHEVSGHAGDQRDAVLTLCPIWRDPWMVVGRDTFAGDLLARAGARVWHPPGDARYPRVELEAARAAGVGLVLLPDEPYPFGASDLDAFDGWEAALHLVDGAALTWWGPRTPPAHRELRRLAAAAPRLASGPGPDAT